MLVTSARMKAWRYKSLKNTNSKKSCWRTLRAWSVIAHLALLFSTFLTGNREEPVGHNSALRSFLLWVTLPMSSTLCTLMMIWRTWAGPLPLKHDLVLQCRVRADWRCNAGVVADFSNFGSVTQQWIVPMVFETLRYFWKISHVFSWYCFIPQERFIAKASSFLYFGRSENYLLCYSCANRSYGLHCIVNSAC